jgi:hypothetical protein
MKMWQLLLNVIYLCILPAAVVKTSAVVAIDATDAALGPWVGSFMSILIAISVFGSGNGLIIYGGRFLVMTLLSSPFSGSLV